MVVAVVDKNSDENEFTITFCRQMSLIHATNMGAQEKPNTNSATTTSAMTK